RANRGRELAHFDGLIAHWLFLAFRASLREKNVMSDPPSTPIVLRLATIDDALAITLTIHAAFEEFRGKLVPESGAFAETPRSIAAELESGAGAIIAERNGSIVGCVIFRLYEGDLYFGRLSVLPEARGIGLAKRLIAAVEREARALG